MINGDDGKLEDGLPDRLMHDHQMDEALRQILTQTRVIAVVGHSNRPDRPSYQVANFLRQAGYRVYPVNPAVTEIDGQPCYSGLKAVPEGIDLVNVFRRSEFLPEIVQDAIEVGAKTIWAQLGIAHPVAAQTAGDRGLNCIMDACIKIEYLRLGIDR